MKLKFSDHTQKTFNRLKIGDIIEDYYSLNVILAIEKPNDNCYTWLIHTDKETYFISQNYYATDKNFSYESRIYLKTGFILKLTDNRKIDYEYQVKHALKN